MRRLSHVIGFDDAPFDRQQRGDVRLVGVVCAGARVEGVLTAKVRRDGANAARAMASAIEQSKFAAHLQLILLQGVAVAGFNVVDVFDLHARAGLPVLIVARRQPSFEAIREALLTRVRGGARKWRIIERLGPMEAAAGVFVQRVGISREEAVSVLEHFAIHSRIPEPLRLAHLIAESRGRV